MGVSPMHSRLLCALVDGRDAHATQDEHRVRRHALTARVILRPMPEMTIQDALQLALRHHRANDLPHAESIYRQILAIDPNNPDALHLLGVIASESGRPDAAADLISRAVAIRGDVP